MPVPLAEKSKQEHVSRSQPLSVIAVVACALAAGAALLSSSIHLPATLNSVTTLHATQPSAPVIAGTGFQRNAAYPSTPEPVFDTDALRYGSYLGGDGSMGQVTTRWYECQERFSILVSGYPDGRLAKLTMEGADRNHHTTGFVDVLPAKPPGELWSVVEVAVPKEWSKCRIVATDHSPGFRGWIGFSEPVVVAKSGAALLIHLALLFLSALVMYVLVLGPGLAWRLLGNLEMSFYWLPVPGLLVSVVLGLLIWKGPHFISPSRAAMVSVFVTALLCLVAFVKKPMATALDLTEIRVLSIIVLLSVMAITKASYSIGPKDELYGGTVSRSLEVGARSDSRINYHLIQMFATREHAFGPLSVSLLAPWNFSHRGPIAGLATAPVVLINPVRIPAVKPDQPWQVFDRQGFAAYRASFIVLSSCFLIPVFGLLRLFLPDPRAFLAFLVVAGSPFVIHELYFTWPKIIAAGLVVISCCLAWQHRYAQSGLLLGIAYLSHPSALLSVPVVFAMTILRLNLCRGLLVAWSKQMASLSVIMAFWRVVNGKHYAQGGFFQYLYMAENRVPTAWNWIAVRIHTLTNTLLPLHLFLFDAQNPAITLVGVAPPVVTFFLQDWTSLPSGAGLLLYLPLLFWFILGFRRARAEVSLLVLLPLGLILIYWGNVTTGLLRDALHAWFIGTLCLGAWCWLTFGTTAKRWWMLASAALLLRGVEVLGILIAPGIFTSGHIINPDFFASDALFLSILITSSLGLAAYTALVSERLRTVDQVDSSVCVR